MIRAYKPPMFCRPLSVTVGMLVSLLLNHSAFTQTSTFSTPGTYTWVCPAGVNTINVDLYGAGGGGGYGGTSNGQGGGGGGGFSSRASIPVSCGVSYTIIVGTGGTGGTATVAAGSGSLTSATFGAIVVTASGGSGGNNYSIGGAGGAGGIGSGGTTNRIGGNGGTGNASGSGGGGGCAGTTGNGGSGLNGGGVGGTSGGGSAGNGGNGVIGSNTGISGIIYGGGGSGGTRNSNGGSGAQGFVSISFTCPAAPVVSAGANQNLAACATTTTLAGSAVPACMSGLWTVIAGTASITTPTLPNSTVTDLISGTSATLRWTITNPNCGSYSADMIISIPVGPGCYNYCSSPITPESTVYGNILSVSFNTINNASAGSLSGYPHFTNISTTIAPGVSYDLTVIVNADVDGNFFDPSCL